MTNGIATYTTSSLLPGTYLFSASYSGDANFSSGTSSSSFPETIQSLTTTTLTSNVSSAFYGQPITLSARVAEQYPGTNTPMGSVDFYDGSNLLGIGTLNGGVATFSTSSLTLGNNSLTAVYVGTTSDYTSTSSAFTLTVLDITLTTLTSNISPSTYGQSITLSAGVSEQAPGTNIPFGTVNFYDGSNFLGSNSLSSGVATFSTSSLAPGSHYLYAVYLGSTLDFTSTSTYLIQSVNQATVTININAAPSSAFYGTAITLSSTIAAVPPEAGTPSGFVTFYDGTTPIGGGSLTGGVATFSTSSLLAGIHSLSAIYYGDINFTGNTSGAISETIQSYTVITLYGFSSPAVYGQLLTLSAAVAAASPGADIPMGSVNFYDGSSLLGSSTLISGIATFTTASLAPGNHYLTAVYAGNAIDYTSTSGGVTETIQSLTSTVLTSNGSPLLVGQPITFTASVTDQYPGTNTPSGTVYFYNGSNLLGSGTLSAGTATFSTSSLAVGSYNLDAIYSGSMLDYTSVSPIYTQVVEEGSVAISLSASPNPAPYSTTVTLSVYLSAVPAGSGIPTGSVTFYDGSNQIGSVAETSGVATFTTGSLIPGVHSLTASYSGDMYYSGNTSSAVSETIQALTTTTFTSSLNPSTYGQPITLTAKVNASIAPSGSVNFYDGSNLLGTVTLSSGAATYSSSSLIVGSHNLMAVYEGNTLDYTSSATLTQVVNAQNILYVDSDWSGDAIGTVISNPNPLSPGNPATAAFGSNAFATISSALASSNASGATILVTAGTKTPNYQEDVAVNQNVALIFQPSPSTSVIDINSLGDSLTSSTVQISSGVDVMIDGDNNSTSILGAISGGGELIKAGTGSLTLSSIVNLNGGIQVSAGTLMMANSGSLGTPESVLSRVQLWTAAAERQGQYPLRERLPLASMDRDCSAPAA